LIIEKRFDEKGNHSYLWLYREVKVFASRQGIPKRYKEFL